MWGNKNLSWWLFYISTLRILFSFPLLSIFFLVICLFYLASIKIVIGIKYSGLIILCLGVNFVLFILLVIECILWIWGPTSLLLWKILNYYLSILPFIYHLCFFFFKLYFVDYAITVVWGRKGAGEEKNSLIFTACSLPVTWCLQHFPSGKRKTNKQNRELVLIVLSLF